MKSKKKKKKKKLYTVPLNRQLICCVITDCSRVPPHRAACNELIKTLKNHLLLIGWSKFVQTCVHPICVNACGNFSFKHQMKQTAMPLCWCGGKPLWDSMFGFQKHHLTFTGKHFMWEEDIQTVYGQLQALIKLSLLQTNLSSALQMFTCHAGMHGEGDESCLYYHAEPELVGWGGGGGARSRAVDFGYFCARVPLLIFARDPGTRNLFLQIVSLFCCMLQRC